MAETKHRRGGGKARLSMNGMAFVKVKYIPRGPNAKAGAKSNIRYIQHRAGRDKAKISRTLFGGMGKVERQEAYRMIDTADPGVTYFTVIINFDPQTEDTKRDLNHREITSEVLATAARELGVPVVWVAALHDDHTRLRHIHALAIAKAPRLPAVLMREAATQAAQRERREKDRDYALTKEREPETQREEGRVRERTRSK
jgi:hypothetical protein